MKYFFLSLLVLALGCGREATDREATDHDAALSNLRAQVEKLRQAVLHEDHAMVAELTCPTVVRMLGGRAKFTARLELMAAKMNEEGFRFDSVKTAEPLGCTESAGELYSIIPQEVQLISLKGDRIVKSSYLIGVSSDGGVTWKFLDGQGIGTDRQKLETVLPHFPKDLKLPAVSDSRS